MARTITVTVTEAHVQEAEWLDGYGWDRACCCPVTLGVLDALGLPHQVESTRVLGDEDEDDDGVAEQVQVAVAVGPNGIVLAPHQRIEHVPASLQVMRWYDEGRDNVSGAPPPKPTFPVIFELEVPE